jgi:hypothetical protein
MVACRAHRHRCPALWTSTSTCAPHTEMSGSFFLANWRKHPAPCLSPLGFVTSWGLTLRPLHRPLGTASVVVGGPSTVGWWLAIGGFVGRRLAASGGPGLSFCQRKQSPCPLSDSKRLSLGWSKSPLPRPLPFASPNRTAGRAVRWVCGGRSRGCSRCCNKTKNVPDSGTLGSQQSAGRPVTAVGYQPTGAG